METNKMALIFAVAAISLMAGCIYFVQESAESSNGGRVVFTVADAAADMGVVTSVKVTVDSLQVQNAASGGWTTISSSPHTYDLLQLKASKSQSLLADTTLGAGTYGQVRMHISKVMITDSSGEHEAKLPSNDLKIVGGFEARPNSTTIVTFDFLADRSVHMAGNGKYILAPVVRMLGYEDAEVDATSKENVKVAGGRIKTDMVVGMDAQGNVGVGAGIPADANIEINGGSILVLDTGATVNGNAPAAHASGIISIGEQLPLGNGAEQASGSDLNSCTAIPEQQERLSCIARWCGSENRDYNKCYALTDENDKMGCLNKCNPNSNI